MEDLMKFFIARRNSYHTNPKLIDEVIYTPYVYDPPIPDVDVGNYNVTGDLLGVPELRADNVSVPKARKNKFDTTSTEAEIFLFEYGTVVIWGMTEAQEKRFLSSMYVTVINIASIWFAQFREENVLKLKSWVSELILNYTYYELKSSIPVPEDVEMEDLNYYYANYSRCVKISLQD